MLGLRVPTEFGGPGGKVRDVLVRRHPDRPWQFQCRAGASVTLRVLRTAAEQPGDTRKNGKNGSRASNAGIIVGNAITDGAGRAPSSADTKVLPDTDGVLRLNGYKFYSTGTLFADVIAVSALDADGRDVQAIIPADRAGVELFDDWDGFGQRTTASGGTRFTDVEVHPTRSSPCPTAPARALDRFPAAVSGVGGGRHRLCRAGRCRRLRADEGASGIALGGRHARTPIPLCCKRSERSRPPPRRAKPSC